MSTDNSQHTILTIDDEPIVRQSFRLFLEDLNYSVLEAESGASGIDIFMEEKPDLVLLDLNMPYMDGLEVLEILRERAPETPFIVISGTGRVSDIAQALRLGAWDYLFKPIHDLTVLDHAINRSLERASLLREKKLYQERLEQQVEERTKQLRTSEEKYRLIFENLQDIYFETSLDGMILEISPSVIATSSYSRSDLIGSNAFELYPDVKARNRMLEQVQQNGFVEQYEIALRDKNGNMVPCSITAKIIPSRGQEPSKISGTIRNISDKKRTEAALVESEKQYRSLVSNIPVGLFRYRIEDGGSYITANEALAKILGYQSVDELMATHPDDLYVNLDDKTQLFETLLQDGKVVSSELVIKTKNGDQIWTSISAYVFKNETGRIEYIDTMLEDISLRKEAEETIRHLSYYDFLTELPNRTMFLYRLKQSLASSRRNENYSGTIIIDLDRFKVINESLGHNLGDIFLQHIAKRLVSLTRDDDTVARIGGDEFAIIFTELSPSLDDAGRFVQHIAEKIRLELAKPFYVEGHELFTTASIGITMFPTGDENADTILKHAATAVNKLKEQERNACLFYLPDMQQAVNKRLSLEKELRSAITKDEFKLYFQPQVDYSGNIIGAESLIRWIHPEKGVIPPNDFISIAEETGLIIPMGDWVIKTACAHIKQWLDQGLIHGLKYISVNVSPKQFRQEGFTDIVTRHLDETGIPPSLLSIEITEGVAINDLEDTAAKMNILKRHGLSFSIDDFGTGYSALSYLNRLPIDQLKIDRSFVTGIAEDSASASIVSTIIVMAKSMGFSVVAEGVETRDELDFLFKKECRIFQGYYYSPPVPAGKFEEMLIKNQQ